MADSHGGGLARRQGRELRRDASAKCAEPVDGRAHHPDALDAELARRRVHRVDAARRLEADVSRAVVADRLHEPGGVAQGEVCAGFKVTKDSRAQALLVLGQRDPPA